jgi:hypothetical protein
MYIVNGSEDPITNYRYAEYVGSLITNNVESAWEFFILPPIEKSG